MKNVSNSLSEEQKLQLRQYVYNIVGCCQEVHRELGCYLNEYMYQDALEIAFHDAKIDCVRFILQLCFMARNYIMNIRLTSW